MKLIINDKHYPLGINGIRIGKSTKYDVIRVFGDDYKQKLNDNRVYEGTVMYEMFFESLGIYFEFNEEDKNKIIVKIEISSCSNVVSEIGEGDKLLKISDGIKYYGVPKWTTAGNSWFANFKQISLRTVRVPSQNSNEFFNEESHIRGIITNIDIFDEEYFYIIHRHIPDFMCEKGEQDYGDDGLPF